MNTSNETEKNNIPNPGSKEAREKGCSCPVIDNHYGKGFEGVEGQFIFNQNCEIHGY